jgi:GT2 family glycosyltransferase/glycosyltransferase involved in cell wall biosynthesis
MSNLCAVQDRSSVTTGTERTDRNPSKREFQGNIEGINLNKVSGWVMDTHSDESGVPVELFVGNQIVGSGIASIKRKDLAEAGLTDGAFAFEFSVSENILDGQKHLLHVRHAKEPKILASRTIQSSPFAVSTITAIEAGVLTGFIALVEATEHTGYDIDLLVDNEVVSCHQCTYDSTTNKFRFEIVLPSSVFDDNRHIFTVQIRGQLTEKVPLVERLSSIQTPWQYLSDSGNGTRLSALSKIAAHRYAALQTQLDLIDCENLNVEQLERLQIIKRAHDVLVEGYEGRSKFPKLVLPKVKNPTVSIVIPVHNKIELTYHCLASLILANNKTSFEVIVVDDKSNDQTLKIVDIVQNTRYIRNETNLGFLLTSCKGADAAKGEFIVFLNNDTEVTSGWLDALVQSFNTFDSVGMAGSKLIYPNGKLQEAGGIVWGSGRPWNIGNGENAEHPKYNYTRQADYLSGASLMIDSKVWKKISGFSKEFAPAYYEDTDLAFKVREAGFKTLYCPFSTVIHFEGMSNGRDTNAGIKRFQSVNAPKFRSKWRHAYRHNGQEGKRLSVEMDRGVDFRALVVDYATPRPDQDAGGYAAVQEMKLLQELGFKVTFAPNNMAHLGRHTEALQKQGVECIFAPFHTSIGQFLEERGADYDLVYITRYDIAEAVIDSVRQFTKAKIIFNNADLHFLRELRAALSSGQSSLEEPIRTRDRELMVMRKVDAVLSYNEVEHSVITSHNLTQDNVFKCPWVLKDKRSVVPFKERSGIAFLGGFNHAPNREAVKYFVDSIMPLLRIAQPDIRFHVYGSRVSDDIAALACEDVVIEGFADSLSQVFDTCRVFVGPLLSGAGIKGKVLESMAYGVPSVLTPVAAEATGLTHNHSALIVNDPTDWCNSIVSLYNDSNLWETIAGNCNALVHTEYSADQGLKKMEDVLRYVELEPAENRSMLFSKAS